MRLNYLFPNYPKIKSIFASLDEHLFSKFTSNPYHVFHQMLPPVKSKFRDMRRRTHNSTKISPFFFTSIFLFAFDAVDHSLLIQQLETFFGLSVSCIKWITSYLSNRSSVVAINNSYSTLSSFTYGVPQGSVPGLFFLFFILLNSQGLFQNFLFRVNFMLMTLTSLLHFLNINYLLLSLKIFLVLAK